MCNYIYAPFYHLPISLSFSDHPSIQAWSFDFMVSCKKNKLSAEESAVLMVSSVYVQTGPIWLTWHVSPNTDMDAGPQRWTYLKPGGHMRV